jgi:hypothetical protein
MTMARFGDFAREDELSRVEAILRYGGIGYVTIRDDAGPQGIGEIRVAEEDLPHAEELVTGV